MLFAFEWECVGWNKWVIGADVKGVGGIGEDDFVEG